MAIHNGLILTRYRKSTYFQESDATLAHNANCWYIFGTSQDIIEPGQARNRLAVFLRKRISSEICFDLALGIRKNNPSSTSQIHIIQSNYIDATMYENQNNLQNSKLMIHVDPETILRNQTIHKYNNILSKFK
jgi:hypothetical protein